MDPSASEIICPYVYRWFYLFHVVEHIRRQAPQQLQSILVLTIRTNLITELYRQPGLQQRMQRFASLNHRCGIRCDELAVPPNSSLEIVFNYNRKDEKLVEYFDTSIEHNVTGIARAFPSVCVNVRLSFTETLEQILRPAFLPGSTAKVASYLFKVFHQPIDGDWWSTGLWQPVVVLEFLSLDNVLAATPIDRFDPSTKRYPTWKFYNQLYTNTTADRLPFCTLVAEKHIPMQSLVRTIVQRRRTPTPLFEGLTVKRFRQEISYYIAIKMLIHKTARNAPLVYELYSPYVLNANVLDRDITLLKYNLGAFENRKFYAFQNNVSFMQLHLPVMRFVFPPVPKTPFRDPPSTSSNLFVGLNTCSRNLGKLREYLRFLHVYAQHNGTTHPRHVRSGYRDLHSLSVPQIEQLISYGFVIDPAGHSICKTDQSLAAYLLDKHATVYLSYARTTQ